MKPLDHDMRRRLGELARQERSPLGAVDRQRIVARAGELEAGGRGTGWLLGASLGAAAAMFVWYLAPTEAHRWAEPTVADGAGATEEPLGVSAGDGEDLAPPPCAAGCAQASPPSCAREDTPEVAPPRRHGRGARAVDVGDRARFVLFGQAEGRIESVGACRTVFVLERGRVLVHARDLRGGELVVRTSEADVVVHGTVFDVQLEPGSDALRVAVAEGAVGVTSREAGAELALLAEGDVVDVSGGEPTLGTLPSEAVEELLETVDDPPARTARRSRPIPPPAPEPPRGEVVGGNPQVHQPRWTSDP